MNLRAQLERVSSTTPPSRRLDRVAYHGVRVALAVMLAIVTYLLFPSAPAVDFPVYEVGSVAPDNVIAPFGFTVPKSAQELQRERDDMARSAEPIFAFDSSALDSSRAQLQAFANAVTTAAGPTLAHPDLPTVVRAAAGFGVKLTPTEAAYLAAPMRRESLVGAITRVYDRWLRMGVASNSALNDVRGDILIRQGGETRRASADNVMTFGNLLSRAQLVAPDPNSTVGSALYVRLLSSFFHPTIVLDRAATEQRRDELERSVPESKYAVRAGEKIIGAHEVVGREEHEKLIALRDAVEHRRGGQQMLGRVTGAILFNFLIVAIFGLTLVLFRPPLYQNLRALLLFAIVFLVVLGGAAIVAHMPPPVHPELIPVAVAAIIFSVLFDQRISMIAAMVLAVLIGGQSVYRGTNALFINLIGGAVAAFSVRMVRRRNQGYYSIIPIALAYLIAALAIGLTLDWAWRDIGHSALWGAVNALASVLIAMLILPMAEHFTGIETDLTLLEWSDLNRPLMQRLSLEAPGTYAHTIAIANLAESAANVIGANGLLARVGAYYHDIGKLKKPQYFVENQPKGRNPHDKLKPSTSATIIRNHVREGLELADEFHLPRALRAFITEHHGTGSITYFLEKARERDGPAANPSEFIYPGPIPQSAETAIVMLADGVEAATRVLHEPTPQKIRDVVDHIVRQRMEQGQLREAPLTLRQLDRIKEQFARVLIGMYHNRIDYPASSGGVTAEFASYEAH